MADFRNPYNFIPTLDRDAALRGKPAQVRATLGDGEPLSGFDRYEPGAISGLIRLRLTAVTPLLAVDASRAKIHTIKFTKNGRQITREHKELPLRIVDGRPFLPPTSIKGMLRGAFEAITNSRMGVFAGHDDRLGRRMAAQEGLGLVPARIALDAHGNPCIHLLWGTCGGVVRRPTEPMFAAWLSRQLPGSAGGLPAHGKEVNARVQRFKKEKSGRSLFEYWNVLQVWDIGQPAPPAPAPCLGGGHHLPVDSRVDTVRGWACVTGKNIDKKHDERLFFSTTPSTSTPLSPRLREQWRALISDYQEQHRDEINKKGMAGPPALVGSTWSRHIAKKNGGVWSIDEGERELNEGTLCYARLNATRKDVEALFPVMISRDLHPESPAALLESSLHPAISPGEMSPADRVFGWASQDGAGAWRGRLRVGQTRCMEARVDRWKLKAPVPLAILGAPKPNQGLFYVERAPGSGNHDYRKPNRLRGRKVYPHQHSTEEFWEAPSEDRTQQDKGGKFQEYRRPRDPHTQGSQGEQVSRDDQNRSVSGWVKPGVQFEVEVEVFNLSPFEVGALLWLLQLPEGHHFRLGGGKPLGFGSVKIEVLDKRLRGGEAWGQSFQSLTDTGPWEDDGPWRKVFEETLVAAYGVGGPPGAGGVEQIPFIKAFLRAASGFDDALPTHYPRTRWTGSGPVPPNPEGESFAWFVANNRSTPPTPLGKLEAGDPGLTILPDPAQNRRDR